MASSLLLTTAACSADPRPAGDRPPPATSAPVIAPANSDARDGFVLRAGLCDALDWSGFSGGVPIHPEKTGDDYRLTQEPPGIVCTRSDQQDGSSTTKLLSQLAAEFTTDAATAAGTVSKYTLDHGGPKPQPRGPWEMCGYMSPAGDYATVWCHTGRFLIRVFIDLDKGAENALKAAEDLADQIYTLSRA